MFLFGISGCFSFRDAFSRTRTWILFSMVILGFIGATDMTGITSFCRFWGLDKSAYYAFFNLFRSEAFSLYMLICLRTNFVLAQNGTIMVEERAVYLLPATSSYNKPSFAISFS
jgi:hypothetical protein